MPDENALASGPLGRLRARGLRVGDLAVVGPFLAIAGSETALYLGYLDVTLWGHALTLLACLFAPLWLDGETATLRAFALVPLFRLVNLGMPIFFVLTLSWFPFIYGPLVPALYLVVSGDNDLNPRAGLRSAVTLFPAILLGAWLLAHLEFAVIQPDGLLPAWSPLHVAFLAVVMIGFVGFVEELLFRGILQRTLESRMGYWPGILTASVVFGLMHSGYSDPNEVALAAGIGLAFGLLYDWTDSLAAVTVAHGLLNIFLFGALPMDVLRLGG
ncbi:CPBP family intramembrane glutamic endopeptidase [Halorientalis halophila]|uniref:CPBP family intramembrane glutamic endopeptidase n=1 Tax=Halorientalis halophila TaxID=3108499 RepID=UPI00300BC0DC